MAFLSHLHERPQVLTSVCVYCGSSNYVAEFYKDSARSIGTALAQRGMTIVYGGGHVGLMGEIADAAMKAGGRVIGIIPEHIRAHEVQHEGITELHVVPDMHTRKRMMAERAHAFIILPGGIGTLDEMFEIIIWKKLRLHNKPIILYNDRGYWDPALQLIEKMVGEGFAQPPDLALYKVASTVDTLLAALTEGKGMASGALTGRM
ncbi:MAG: TIGR00730 family Rossman fold protein [Bdellovibrionales bacterium]